MLIRMKHIDKKTAVLLSVLFPVLLVAWMLGFDLGAFGTVFYRNIMTAWVFAIVTFLSLIYVKWHKKVPVKWRTLLILLIPILWPAIDYADQHILNQYIHYFIVFDYFLILITLCYSAYVFLKLIKYDIFDPLTHIHKIFILVLAILFGALGFFVGYHHYWFFECGHFQVSGEYVPENCFEPKSPNFQTLYRRAW